METAPLKITISPPVQVTKVPDVEPESSFFGEDGFSFKDLLDVINPFQQLPVISTFYREASGDTISTASRLAGGALLGGPVGFLVALANTVIEEVTGKDVGANLLASASSFREETELAQHSDPMPTHGAVRKGYNAYIQAQSLFS